MTEETLFHEALAKTDPQEQAAFLDAACAGQPELRAAVEALLAAHEDSGSLLDRPQPEPATTRDYQPQVEPGLVIAGRYQLQQKIGEGGMGAVWVAKQTEPVKRKVALKLIKTGMDSRTVLARFEQERQALALMDHPHIARVLDGGMTATGQPFFVMELVNGLPLTRFCDEVRLTPRERLKLFVPICQAVQHAHQKGIVHRDLKPANILVTLIDGKPVPKVIDFGVAKATAGKLTDESLSTQFGAVVGTLEYMAPEQAGYAGEDIDTRADIYSLGVILYELLTGLRPIDAKRLKQAALTEIIRIIQEEEPSRPSTRLSTAESMGSLAALRQIEPKKLMALLRGELDWVVMKCLEKKRDRRYETANALARDVQRYLADEAVEARPPSAGYRLGKLLRRHKGPVLAASLVLLALLVGVMGTSLGMIAAEQRRQEAEQAQAAEAEQRQLAQANEAKALAAAEAEKTAKEREAEQRQKAEKARDRTRQVLDAMTSSVTGDSLSTQKEISAEQKKFLSEVLSYYQEFAGEKAEDEASRARTARAANRVAMIEYRLGRKKEAAAAFRLARDGYAKLVADLPNVPAYRQELAISHHNLGFQLADLGKREEAAHQYRQALAIQEKLTTDFPTVPAYRQELAHSHVSLGNLLVGLGKRPEAEQQYRQALAIQEKLTTNFPAVPEYRRVLAGSHLNLGVLLANLGKGPEAEKQKRQAQAIWRKLVADFPNVPAYCQDLASGHNSLGALLANLGKGPEAEQQYRQALAIQQKLAAELPTVPAYRQDLATNHNNMGKVLAGLGKRPEAEQQYRQALAIQQKLTADFPTVPAYLLELARSHNGLGLLLRDLGKRPEAEQQYCQAQTIREKLAAEFPNVPQYQIELGGGYCNLGNLVRDSGRPSDSLLWFEKAIHTLTAAYEQERRLVLAKLFLRNSHAGRASAYDRLQRFTDAVKDWDKAIELTPKAEQAVYRAARATARINAGLVAEAVAEVADLSRIPNWNARQWYDFACVYGLASGKSVDNKQPYADRAIELLQRAVKAGYHDAAHMKKDTGLDPLRGRDDFKKLVAELEKKATPPEKQP
jgi:eukaryotic-like serine/threonine-protein kinase